MRQNSDRREPQGKVTHLMVDRRQKDPEGREQKQDTLQKHTPSDLLPSTRLPTNISNDAIKLLSH
jgi:hypothetical protein